MQGLVRCCTHFPRPTCTQLFASSLTTALRCCATVPTEDDVRKAYQTLGVHVSATLTDVKKRYGVLAKEHHPDVSASSATSSTNRMMDINNAYNTVKQFHQSGRRLSEAASRPSSSGSSFSSPGSSSYYTQQDGPYQPWYEDMDPLMYELMWEEMRRQNEADTFSRTMPSEGFYRPHEPWRQPRGGNPSSRPRHPTDHTDGGGPAQGGKKAPQKPTTTWPEEQVKAMVNMYQDGKSFEFIANALGKPNAAAVMEEFNRWSSDSQAQRRQGNNRPKQNKRRRHSSGQGPFYYTESPDEVPFELYEMMEEEPYYDGAGEDSGNPFGYYGDGSEAYDIPHATPFYGVHQMSGGPAPYMRYDGGGNGDGGGGRRVYNSSRKVSFKPARNHRGGPPHKNKRHQPNGGNNNNKGGGSGSGFQQGNGAPKNR